MAVAEKLVAYPPNATSLTLKQTRAPGRPKKNKPALTQQPNEIQNQASSSSSSDSSDDSESESLSVSLGSPVQRTDPQTN